MAAAELIESELFGHEKGSFTGARAWHVGKFEQANGGTIFLDEIGDMPLTMQAKLLRVLEESEVERIGGEKPIRVDAQRSRPIEAWNVVREGKFRQDLFHRVYVFRSLSAPLRERREDIPKLIEHFAAQVCSQNGWKAIPFSAESVAALQAYAWPGNVRKLRNVVERVMLLATSGEVDLPAVQLALPEHVAAAGGSGSLADRVQGFEREVILAELKRSGNHITNAAKALGLERSHLYKKAEQVGIDLSAVRQGG